LWGEPRISPDGRLAAVAKLGADPENADLWLVDENGKAVPFTNTPVHEGSPVWSPDAARLAFFAKTAEKYDVLCRSVSGSRSEVWLRSEFPTHPSDWSRDGQFLVFTAVHGGTNSDIWALSITDRRSGPLLGTIVNEGYAALSPDGRWLAFQSDESGRNGVYVRRFEGIEWERKRHFLVSSDGGGRPRWRADGKELYYMTQPGRIMAVATHASEDDIRFDPPRTLFFTRPVPNTWNLYDVTPDGERFLVNLPLELPDSASIRVLTNWSNRRE
jgi:Tol biopolymer transport system component